VTGRNSNTIRFPSSYFKACKPAFLSHLPFSLPLRKGALPMLLEDAVAGADLCMETQSEVEVQAGFK
jgi:hypothetical protein